MGQHVATFPAVTPGLVPGVHVFSLFLEAKTWMAATSAAMTKKWVAPASHKNKEN
jgi:hypothetical protein